MNRLAGLAIASTLFVSMPAWAGHAPLSDSGGPTPTPPTVQRHAAHAAGAHLGPPAAAPARGHWRTFMGFAPDVAKLPAEDLGDGLLQNRAPRFALMNCPPEGIDYHRYYVICVDVSNDRFQFARVFPDTGAVLRPERSILIAVLLPADRKVSLTWQGTKGVYVPGVRSVPGKSGSEATRGGEGRRVTWTVEVRTLPPMLPPGGKITLALTNADGTKTFDTYTYDFVITDTYSGAVRVGVAAVGLGAVDGHYSLATVPGSGQSEIVGAKPAPFDFELVLGYAAFLDSGGRPAVGCSSAPWCFAPYFGLGLVTQRDGKLDLFTSVHAGIEWAPTPGFSLAATLVARRVTRLAPGLSIGAPATVNDTLTTSGYGLGAGLVFNVGFDFLKVAAKGAAQIGE